MTNPPSCAMVSGASIRECAGAARRFCGVRGCSFRWLSLRPPRGGALLLFGLGAYSCGAPARVRPCRPRPAPCGAARPAGVWFGTSCGGSPPSRPPSGGSASAAYALAAVGGMPVSWPFDGAAPSAAGSRYFGYAEFRIIDVPAAVSTGQTKRGFCLVFGLYLPCGGLRTKIRQKQRFVWPVVRSVVPDDCPCRPIYMRPTGRRPSRGAALGPPR